MECRQCRLFKVYLKECPTKTSTQQSESTDVSHLKNLEKSIEPGLLKEFYLTKHRHTDWEGSMTVSDLYDVWDKMFEHQNQNTLQPPINCEANELQKINNTTNSTSQQTIVLNNISPSSNSTDKNLSTNISTPSSSNKSFDDVMADVIKWPEPVPNTTRKYCRVKLLTVVTSQKWLEIKSAQDEEKAKKCIKRVIDKPT